MAVYFTDFSESEVGQPPVGLSLLLGPENMFLVAADEEARGGKVLRFQTPNTNNADHALSIDSIGEVPAGSTIEVIGRIRALNSNTRAGFGVRIDSESGCSNGGVAIQRGQEISAGSRRFEARSLAGSNLIGLGNLNVLPGTWVYLRFRIRWFDTANLCRRHRIDIKFWTGTLEDQPVDWITEDINVNFDIPESGLLGVCQKSGTDNPFEWDWFGVATDDDEVPTEPIPDPPIWFPPDPPPTMVVEACEGPEETLFDLCDPPEELEWDS